MLITYDSADPPEGHDGEEEVEVRMIDFAHAVPVDGQGQNGEGPAEAPADEGYLHGLNNVGNVKEYGTGHNASFTFSLGFEVVVWPR